MQALANVYRRFFSPAQHQPENQKADNFLSQIPAELLIKIFGYLHSYDLVQLGRTSHYFHQLTNDRTLDIVRRKVFQQMRTERIGTLIGNWHDIIYTKKGIVEFDGTQGNFSTHLLDSKGNRTPFINHPVHQCNMTDSHFYTIFHQDYLAIQFIGKETFAAEAPINLSKIIGDEKQQNLSLNSLAIGNYTLVALANQIIGFCKGSFAFRIPPLVLEGSEIMLIRYAAAGDSLVINYKQAIKSQNRQLEYQFRYSLSSRQIMNSRRVSDQYPFKSIARTDVTAKYIVNFTGLKKPCHYIHVEVQDLSFNPVINFFIDHAPKIDKNGTSQFTFGKKPFIYCYENRLVALINVQHLLFIDLSTGKLIKEWDIGIIEDELTNDFRVTCEGEDIMVVKKKSIEHYDLWTGNYLHRFATSSLPVFVTFAEPYHLVYTQTNKKNESHVSHLKVKSPGIHKDTHQRKRRR
jgi:hypothetical protein